MRINSSRENLQTCVVCKNVELFGSTTELYAELNQNTKIYFTRRETYSIIDFDLHKGIKNVYSILTC